MSISTVVGARQVFRGNNWFLKNNRARFQFLYGILHYLITNKNIVLFYFTLFFVVVFFLNQANRWRVFLLKAFMKIHENKKDNGG